METDERAQTHKRKIEDTGPEEVPSKRHAPEQRVSLQHMPDQVMLEILKHCTTREYKALGYINARFAQLVSDRTLWINVDSGGPISMEQLYWILTFGVRDYTKSLKITGLIEKLDGCGGFVHCRRPRKANSDDPGPRFTNMRKRLQIALHTGLPRSVTFYINERVTVDRVQNVLEPYNRARQATRLNRANEANRLNRENDDNRPIEDNQDNRTNEANQFNRPIEDNQFNRPNEDNQFNRPNEGNQFNRPNEEHQGNRPNEPAHVVVNRPNEPAHLIVNRPNEPAHLVNRPNEAHQCNRPNEAHQGNRPNEPAHLVNRLNEAHQCNRPNEAHQGNRPNEPAHLVNRPNEAHQCNRPNEAHQGNRPNEPAHLVNRLNEAHQCNRPNEAHQGNRPNEAHQGNRPNEAHQGNRPNEPAHLVNRANRFIRPHAFNGGRIDRPEGFEDDDEDDNVPQRPRVAIIPHPNPRYAGNPGIYTTLPQWPTYIQRRLPVPQRTVKKCFKDLNGCAGPKFTLIYPLLRQIVRLAPNLQELYLEYCNLNYDTIKIEDFPPRLARLSLKGCMIFNSAQNSKPFLHKMYDFVPKLEFLDVSECSWLEPDYIMTFSKFYKLKELRIRYCKNMKDYVAYASLSTKHGFKSLEILDYSGSPVCDSEVSPLGWLPNLRELSLSPAPKYKNCAYVHVHYKDDPIMVRKETADWEDKPPSYYPMPKDGVLYDYIPNTAQDPLEQMQQPNAGNAIEPSEDKQEPQMDKETAKDEESTTTSSSDKGETSTGNETAKVEDTTEAKEETAEDNDSSKDEKEPANIADTSEGKDEPAKAETSNAKAKKEIPLEPQVINEDYYVPCGDEYQREKLREQFGGEEPDVAVESESDEDEVIVPRPPSPVPPNRTYHDSEILNAVFYLRDVVSPVITEEPVSGDEISDSAMRYFGQAADVNFVHFDVRARRFAREKPSADWHRPLFSPLVRLSVRGYKNITNLTLNHLLSAAPNLKYLDVRRTRVNMHGVRHFLSVRPDVDILWDDPTASTSTSNPSTAQ